MLYLILANTFFVFAKLADEIDFSMLLHASSSRPGFQKRRYEGPSSCCSLRQFGQIASFQRERAPSCVRVHGPLGPYREDFM
jgi:hypothetical protein